MIFTSCSLEYVYLGVNVKKSSGLYELHFVLVIPKMETLFVFKDDWDWYIIHGIYSNI